MFIGNFKYICKKHPPLNITTDLIKRHKYGQIKRSKFKKKSGFSVFTISQCCIERGDFSNLSGLSFVDAEFSAVVRINLLKYNKDIFTRFDYSKFLMGPLVTSFCSQATVKSRNFVIQKFDLSNAYLHVWSNLEKIPTSQTKVHLHGQDAKNYFDKIFSSENIEDFIWVKGPDHDMTITDKRLVVLKAGTAMFACSLDTCSHVTTHLVM